MKITLLKQEKPEKLDFRDFSVGDVYENPYGCFLVLSSNRTLALDNSWQVSRIDPNAEKVGHLVEAEIIIKSP